MQSVPDVKRHSRAWESRQSLERNLKVHCSGRSRREAGLAKSATWPGQWDKIEPTLGGDTIGTEGNGSKRNFRDNEARYRYSKAPNVLLK